MLVILGLKFGSCSISTLHSLSHPSQGDASTKMALAMTKVWMMQAKSTSYYQSWGCEISKQPEGGWLALGDDAGHFRSGFPISGEGS